jgi:hypothetical protein
MINYNPIQYNAAYEEVKAIFLARDIIRASRQTGKTDGVTQDILELAWDIEYPYEFPNK